MRAIADGGGTKADWGWWDGAQIQHLRTNGCNPNSGSLDFWREQLASVALPFQKTRQLYYYGAGCGTAQNRERIAAVLKPLFPKAEVMVESDLMGAARGLFAKKPGIISILGTGTNSAVYNGQNFTDQLPSLGYILGDEGGGAHLGKLLLKAFLHRRLDQELQQKLLTFAPHLEEQFIQKVYWEQQPNAWLGQLARFCKQHVDHPQIKRLIEVNFQAFVDQLLVYASVRERPLGFVGSMAFHFSESLRAVLQKNGLKAAKIIEKPLPALIEFHQNRS